VLKESPEALPPFDITKISRECKIKDISARERLGNLTVTARVLSVEAKEIQVGEGEPPKTIYKGILGDGTGKIQFTAWHDFNLNKGDVIKIIGGYVKSWRGLLQLNFDERARVEREADDALPSIEEIDIERPISIGELIERGGATGVVIEGVVLDVRSGSGLIFRCPECNRVLQKGVCMIHGKAEGVPDLRVKAIIDDGTGALTAILDKSITERILGKSLEECKKLAQEKMDYDIIKDELTNLLVAKPIRVRGNVTSDEFGLMTVGATATLIERDVKHEAEKMLEDLGG
jgi:replication factor A1